jgi:acyl phosphate:glycerol-3-phosphate acyltransferase
MDVLIFIGVLIGSYILGSIPFGLVFVKLKTGQDLRKLHSGRTGGTNAGRAAGRLVGLATAAVDFIKGAVPVWIAGMLLPGNVWLKILAPLAVIIGHNYSIFLAERDEKGRMVLRGGAGGASCVGGSLGLWPPSFLIILPLGALVFYVIGYASIATMSVAIGSAVIFALLAMFAHFPWEFVLYGIFAELLLILALRPNIRRLLEGNERPVGLRARRSKAVHG